MPKTDDLSDLEITPEEDFEAFVRYDIATYPSDFTLQGIKDLWDRNELTIPDFQRGYVWKLKQASLLVESFLLGLPVPPVFLYVSDQFNNLVIDGQQRLITVRRFFDGYFGPPDEKGRQRVFRLEGLGDKSPYKGKAFEDLSDLDKRKLRSYVLRAINIRQLGPSEDTASSIFHIFERLNTGGTPLKPQEVRNCVYWGPIVEELRDVNRHSAWREILGAIKEDLHQRDVELVLRVFALSNGWRTYERPLKDFLNSFMERVRRNTAAIAEFSSRFRLICDSVVQQLGSKPFHLRGPLNAAVLDSVLGTLVGSSATPADLAERFTALIGDTDFMKSVEQSTADTLVVKSRFQKAHQYLLTQA